MFDLNIYLRHDLSYAPSVCFACIAGDPEHRHYDQFTSPIYQVSITNYHQPLAYNFGLHDVLWHPWIFSDVQQIVRARALISILDGGLYKLQTLPRDHMQSLIDTGNWHDIARFESDVCAYLKACQANPEAIVETVKTP